MAATANFTSKISLDDSQFSAGMRRVRSNSTTGMRAVGTSMDRAAAKMRRVGAAMAVMGAKLKRIGMIAGTITFAAAIAGAAAFAKGLKGAIDVGGKLSDLSSRTGIAVKHLVVLEQAFKDNGIAGEKVGAIINKMQKGISDFSAGLSTQVRAFDRLGISYDQIEGKNPIEQFKMIQTALVKIKDPTIRAATAMEIFGRAGGELQALFADTGALDKAAVTIGSQADLLDKNAQTFDRISDLLANAGTKLQGFFVGAASEFAPELLSKLEQINELDFTEFGQKIANAFNAEEMSNIMSTGLTYAASLFGDALIKSVTGAALLFANLFSEEGKAAMAALFQTAAGMKKIEWQETPESAARTKEERLQRVAQGLSPREYKQVDVGLQDANKKIAAFIKTSVDKIGQNSSDLGDVTGSAAAKADFMAAVNGTNLKTGSKPDEESSKNTPWALLTPEQKAARSAKAAKAAKDDPSKMPVALNEPIPADQIGNAPAINGDLTPATMNSGKGGGSFMSTILKNAMSAMANSPVMDHMKKAQDARNGGFSGLAGLYTMQAEKASGGQIGMGSGSVFNNDRKRLGIKSGLQTGGLGATRKVGKEKEQEEKQLEPLESIAENTAEATRLMSEALK